MPTHSDDFSMLVDAVMFVPMVMTFLSAEMKFLPMVIISLPVVMPFIRVEISFPLVVMKFNQWR